MQKVIAAVIAAFVIVSAAAVAEPPAQPQPRSRIANLDNDPFVKLYQARLDLARTEVQRFRAQLDFDNKRLEIARRLHATRAVSYEELIDKVRRVEVSALGVTQAAIRVREMEALVEICRFMREAGREMPILPVEIYPPTMPSPN